MEQRNNQEMSVRPITPGEVTDLQQELVPQEVLETFNRFIGECAINGVAEVRQDEIVDALVEKGLDRGAIFAKGWLNVEDIYRKAGWEVEYDKPGFNETYQPTFTFRTPKKRGARS